MLAGLAVFLLQPANSLPAFALPSSMEAQMQKMVNSVLRTVKKPVYRERVRLRTHSAAAWRPGQPRRLHPSSVEWVTTDKAQYLKWQSHRQEVDDWIRRKLEKFDLDEFVANQILSNLRYCIMGYKKYTLPLPGFANHGRITYTRPEDRPEWCREYILKYIVSKDQLERY